MAAPVLHVRQAEAGQAHEPEHVRLPHDRVVLARAFRDRGAPQREPRVVHEDVDPPAERLGHGRDEGLGARLVVTSSAWAKWPSPGSSASTLSSFSARRAPSATRAPSPASAIAVARPMPLDAPGDDRGPSVERAH